MKTRLLLAAACTAAACLAPAGLTSASSGIKAPPVAHAPARAAADPVTSDGFDALIYDATLYVEVPLAGTFGQDTHRENVIETIRMAAANPYIQHAVFMINSDADSGQLYDKEVVGIHANELEFHAVIQDALFLATFPVFFSDSIFVTDGARVGGMPLKRYFPPGSQEVLAKWVGITTNQLASAAETRGHNPDIVRAMIDETKSLHYWLEGGEIHVTNTAPPSTGHLQDYEHVTPLSEGETVFLNHDQAIKFGLAQHIEEYDAVWVGDLIGAQNWTPANRYGFVTLDLAVIMNGLAPLQEGLDGLNNQLPAIPRNSENSNNPQIERLRDAKRALDRGVDAIDTVAEAVEDLYATHPERHVYFPGQYGQTILADPDAWANDLRQSQQLVSRIRSGLNTLQNAIEALDVVRMGIVPNFGLNPDFVDPYIEALDRIDTHLKGIGEYGNAHYWDDIYKVPYPEDEYGVTYG